MEDSAMLARKKTLLLLVGVGANCALSAALADETSFELNYYEDSPGGAQIAAHDYAAAISAAKAWTAGDPTTALISSTNLCVAYTKTGSFKEASKACDVAVALARGFDSSARGIASESPSSRALSNRGVLRALRGDTAGALSDLRTAGKAPGRSESPARNLAYLV